MMFVKFCLLHLPRVGSFPPNEITVGGTGSLMLAKKVQTQSISFCLSYHPAVELVMLIEYCDN